MHTHTCIQTHTRTQTHTNTNTLTPHHTHTHTHILTCGPILVRLSFWLHLAHTCVILSHWAPRKRYTNRELWAKNTQHNSRYACVNTHLTPGNQTYLLTRLPLPMQIELGLFEENCSWSFAALLEIDKTCCIDHIQPHNTLHKIFSYTIWIRFLFIDTMTNSSCKVTNEVVKQSFVWAG